MPWGCERQQVALGPLLQPPTPYGTRKCHGEGGSKRSDPQFRNATGRAILRGKPDPSMDRPLPLHVPVMLDEVLALARPAAGPNLRRWHAGRRRAHRGAGTLRRSDRPGHLVRSRSAGACGCRAAGWPACPSNWSTPTTVNWPKCWRSLISPTCKASCSTWVFRATSWPIATRGFSFDAPGELDLRFDPTAGEPAWQMVENLDATELANLIYRFGEERHSRRIARLIVEERAKAPIRTADRLADIVRRAVPRWRGPERIDPATRTFQALRIAVNDELGSLEKGLRQIPACVGPGGRAVVISFHSLEDRLVKEAFRDDPRYEALVRKPLRPSEAEVAKNPRSRSAKMRVAGIVPTTQ